MVSQSREITGLVALLAAGVATYVLSPKMGAALAEFMREVFRTDLSSRMDLGSHADSSEHLDERHEHSGRASACRSGLRDSSSASSEASRRSARSSPSIRSSRI